MPEYLAPGVYVEEFEIGAKPIEGVSTSTAGFVGMAERGPLNKPTLVTSLGDYQRKFGDYLQKDPYKDVWMLPYAVEGFFNNGGQRVYITRVADKNAKESEGYIPDISGKSTQLAKNVEKKAIMLKVTDASDLSDTLLLKDESQSEYLEFVSLAKELNLDAPLKGSHAKDDTIIKMEEGTEYNIMEEVDAETTEITLDNVTGLAADNVLIIKDAGNPEICIIKEAIVADNKITLKTSLRYNHAANVKLKVLATTTTKGILLSTVKANYTSIPIINTDADFASGVSIKLGEEYFIINEADNDKVILVADELKYQHKISAQTQIELKQLVPAIKVTASSEGTWGDKLKIVVKKSSISSTKLKEDAVNQDFLDLYTVTGMENGTLLKIHGDPGDYATVKEVIKTEDTARVILVNPISGSKDLTVSTVEFDIQVGFNDVGEIFKNLSMDKEHNRYVEKIITEKSSQFIRVEDVSKTVDPAEKVPLPTQDKEPGWKLSGGHDGIPDKDNINTVYQGKPNDDPSQRTGLYTLKNIDGISLVAIPGITTQHIQNQLIIHCETMKYRFAVLDPGNGADLSAIQEQRNYHDSKYAAIYYPWVKVFDPRSKENINVPPSGHICGIYSRSDTQRGVHKAPANEKVNGALGLEKLNGKDRIITKGLQDILNPKGINCIRSFNGTLKVWGARTISTDSLWKYVNVRRLFIYVEASIEKGTQWVVFEPNNEKLWARVRATITQFLTGVWRTGALMGVKADEAFFVKCDRSTMTQDDIDNGRLICIIGIAPTKPAEFVIFRIAQWAGGSAPTE